MRHVAKLTVDNLHHPTLLMWIGVFMCKRNQGGHRSCFPMFSPLITEHVLHRFGFAKEGKQPKL